MSYKSFRTVFGVMFLMLKTSWCVLEEQPHHQQLQLPNTSGIDGELTAKLGVDQFFSLWLVFNNEEITMSDKPFTIFAPKNPVQSRLDNDTNNLLQHPEAVKKLLLDHVVLGYQIDLANVTGHLSVTTLGGRTVRISPQSTTTAQQPKEQTPSAKPKEQPTPSAKPLQLFANNATVVEARVPVPNGILVIVDRYLFEDGVPNARATNISEVEESSTVAKEEESKQETTTTERTSDKEHVAPPGELTSGVVVSAGSTADKKMDVESTSTSARSTTTAVVTAEVTTAGPVVPNTTFVENVLQVLSFLKSGVRVFQHFLSRSNVSHLLMDGEEYTVFVPTDHAFQRWHPIDWGFYPFSVPEFTESVIVNHFVKGRLKQEHIKNGQTAKTLGGREVVFRKTPTLAVNGAAVVKGDTPVSTGNIMFIGEVLFVSESVVSRLHQQHRDKETPPLLAFPWFGAQFLSHAFLALERDRRFSHITRFLNLADLAPHVAGAGYTFFVPTDTAFEELGLDRMPDNYLSTGDGLDILLNHFVKGRLYDRDLTDKAVLHTLGNETINVIRDKDNVTVNGAKIVETEVFVYNLGTMFYIDRVLFANEETLPSIPKLGGQLTTTTSTTTTTTSLATKSTLPVATAPSVTETVPEELLEENGSSPDVLLADEERTSMVTDIDVTTADTEEQVTSRK